MNKITAEKIFKEITAAKRILLALHVSPDGDSLASVLAMRLVLRRLKKKVSLISYSAFSPRFTALPGAEEIEIADFAKIDFHRFDLFLSLDTAQETKITRSSYPQCFPSHFRIINIDHHVTNTRFGQINLVEKKSSTSEILYQLFHYWQIKIDKKLAQLLLLGILTDTGCFQYSETTAETLQAAADLMKKGASLAEIVLLHYRSYDFKTLKYWGRILDNMQLDSSGQFVWSKVSQEEMEELGVTPAEIEGASSLFAPITLGTEFGIIMNDEGNQVRVSLRSRADFDVSQIAVSFGGGGHQQAASFSLAMPLAEAEKLVLETVRKYIK